MTGPDPMPLNRTVRAQILFVLLALLGPGWLPGQSSVPARPIPYPPMESMAFRDAVSAGTRTRTGQPGAQYWQQGTSYMLGARIDPVTRRLEGRGTVRYLNNSPDTLRSVWFHLYQNLFASGAPRNRTVEVTGGMQLERVAAEGQDLEPSTDDSLGYEVDGTRLRVTPPRPLAPGGSMEFAFQWGFRIPPNGAPRGGDDGEVMFLSYWYPQAAVYDDLSGWQIDRYLGNAEFYMGYGDYDVRITVPAGWLIGATGTLQNADEVLSPDVRARLAQAMARTAPVQIVGELGRGAGVATARGTGGTLTWQYKATNVRDFAFGTSELYVWDATTAQVGSADEGMEHPRTQIHTFYRPNRTAWAWDQSARYAQHSIAFLSRFLWPYPYPHATAIDGVRSCAGMEFPMLTCVGGSRDTLALYSVIVHELAHMWFPMQVGSDEKRHSWQDEGLTRYNQGRAMQEFFRGYERENLTRESYITMARGGEEVALMRHGDQYPMDSRAFGNASYDKMATNLATLRGLIGERRFQAAYREYGRRWAGKHPSPWDFFYTFNDITGEDLWWFWRTWWWETWTLDQSIEEVRVKPGETTIVIADLGLAPMPVRLAIRQLDGSTRSLEIPVDVWLSGAARYEFTLASSSPIASIEIDPDRLFPDIDRHNNVWSSLQSQPQPTRPVPGGSDGSERARPTH